MGGVKGEAVGAEAGGAVQAEDVLLVLAGLLVKYARVEELLRQQGLQPPRRAPLSLTLTTIPTRRRGHQLILSPPLQTPHPTPKKYVL